VWGGQQLVDAVFYENGDFFHPSHGSTLKYVFHVPLLKASDTRSNVCV